MDQKILKGNTLVFFLIWLNAFTPFSVETYLPALPEMALSFGVDGAVINMTVTIFFVVSSIAALIWGPLSDKYGRKKTLVIGLFLYVVGALFCALAKTSAIIISFRVLQGFGAGAAFSISMAVIRDIYTGKKQESVIALVQSMTMAFAIASPILGAFIIELTNWRGAFLWQVVIGIVGFSGALCLTESNKTRSNTSIIGTFKRLGVVLKNPHFSILIPVFQLVGIGSMAFIAASSYIFQNVFGMTSQMYSYFYALCAFAMTAGPLLYIFIARWAARNTIIKVCLLIALIMGLLLCLFGAKSPWLFTLLIFPALVAGSTIRPPSYFMMLAQQRKDIGSASSLIVFCGTMLGSIGMAVASSSSNMILTLGVIYTIVSAISSVVWIKAEKGYIYSSK